ncbi:hypothetical protein N6L27_03185 [Leisingera sp. SS27]|uniref:hypothetical protein n=1 Tax=Leisingera sp. SS27 TaxID=2979462 RepID=UPI00232B42EB|nr:hypothetical protein [Leisingera sp. SS27]MDC0656997.1 hypothetical protein [Leisingera sp. SS27]
MKTGSTEQDPRGLIYESYRIEGITDAQCRSIFFDWALGMDAACDSRADIQALLDLYGSAQPEHPMTTVLRDGLQGAEKPRRRGGWRSRER